MRYLCGELKKVNAKMSTLGANIEVEDSVVANFELKNGALGTLEITTSARPKDYNATISLVGSKGLAQIGGLALNELQIYSPDQKLCKINSEKILYQILTYLLFINFLSFNIYLISTGTFDYKIHLPIHLCYLTELGILIAIIFKNTSYYPWLALNLSLIHISEPKRPERIS